MNMWSANTIIFNVSRHKGGTSHTVANWSPELPYLNCLRRNNGVLYKTHFVFDKTSQI
ncbi:hypothetical protein MFFC18_10550 [Mariniblastus fucicola]|uniref:Uncharacterized protein n=1 Tax=Mariniblastus fucicola TaxID=980251 RepID=A0A5B9P8K6_9BACT|nr:hypothetical protein MFFC18_10550 [Mariniblastus fucicola]